MKFYFFIKNIDIEMLLFYNLIYDFFFFFNVTNRMSWILGDDRSYQREHEQR